MTQLNALQGGEASSTLSKSDILSASYKALKAEGFSAFILPKTDAHCSEYCAERDNLVLFLTGFTGSAGFAALKTSPQKGAVFVDGRYTLQVPQEVDPALFDYENYSLDAIEKWVAADLKPGDKVAYDPLLLSKREFDTYSKRFKKHGLTLEALTDNPLEKIWQNRPPIEKHTFVPHPLEYAGISFSQKISLIQDLMKAKQAHGVFLNFSESIAWLFNIRAPERLSTPAASLYAYVPAAGPCSLFVHESQRTEELDAYFGADVVLENYDDTFEVMAKKASQKSIVIDPSKASMKMLGAIQQRGGKVIEFDDFCNIPRACKNETELRGTRAAHIRDGAAVSNLLAWLDGAMDQQEITELDVVAKLYGYRQQQDLLKGYSFDTISGSGPNGAIVHYCVDEKSNRTLQKEDIFLLDSGGQYLDGTTDITRTISLNKNPTPEQKDRYTRVLKGHIFLASARFPEGTVGSQLDTLARYALWQAGCDYAHGTGHGVGSYLGVHEGPQSISPRPSTVPLLPGMILSNEPGYYKQGEYGIRIESLVIVRRVPKSECADDKNMLCFETITLAPIDTSLMDKKLLTQEEISWVNAYHKRVYDTLIDGVDEATKPWLKRATQSIGNLPQKALDVGRSS